MSRIEVKPKRRRRLSSRARSSRRLRPMVTALEGRALLSTLLVSNTSDSGAGSLRAAINQANADGGGDTIVFSSLFNTPQTITLTSGDLELARDPATTTITGPGASLLTVSGGGESQVFDIEISSLSLTGVTISGGSAVTGGGLLNDGTLTLTDCTISGNSAADDGGGLTNFGTVTLTGCSLSGNDGAGSGGGLQNDGTATLTNCTLSGNSANVGGGLFNYQTGSTATLTNCTVSGNFASARGGGLSNFFGDTLSLSNTIVAGNSGGDVDNDGDYTEDHSLIGGNPLLSPLGDYGGPTPTMALLSGSPAIGAGAAASGAPATDQRGFARVGAVDIGAFQTQGTASMVVNVTTDGLASGLGQLDFRQAINLANVQAGNNTVSFDPSIFGTTPQTITLTAGEIGLGGVGSPIVTGPGGSLLSISGNNASRVFFVNGTSATLSGLTITGGSAPYGGGVWCKGGTLSLSDCIITGNSTTQNDDPFKSGGGVLNEGGTLSLEGCTVSGNSTSQYGGGLENSQGGTTTLTDCFVSGNSATRGGSGLFNYGAATLNLTNCTVSGNSAQTRGGGLENLGPGGAATLTNCTVTANYARYIAGGIWTGGGSSMTMTNTIVAGQKSSGDVIGLITGGSHNLIGDGSGFSSGTDNLLGTPSDLIDPLLTAPGDYGGPTQTYALLPGSPAIGAGTAAGAPTTDQRGLPRTGQIDIGAFQTEPVLVNVTTDEVVSAVGQLTLRQALNLATALDTADTIGFDPTVFGSTPQTITLTLGSLVLSDKATITIAGPGANLVTINANNSGRVFAIQGGSAAMSDLTITGGNAAGLVLGGGLYNDDGNLSLTDCTVSGNSAVKGGGLCNDDGTTTLTGCTISGNTATVAGGGGLSILGGTATLTNCTISGNFAGTGNEGGEVGDGGGLITDFATATLTNCTVSGNTAQGSGGGLYSNSGTVTLDNTIVAGESGGADIAIHNGTVSGSYNLIGDGSGISGGTGNLLGTPSDPIDPLLTALGEYGGPTETMALLPGSPAIGAGTAAGAPPTDQRGLPRTGQIDIGAFQTGPLLVNVTTDEVVSAVGQFSLRQAINLTTALDIAEEIGFDPAVFGSTPQTITLAAGQLTLTDKALTTITGPGANLLTINANNSGRVFAIQGGSAALSGLTITGGNTDGGGGGLYNYHGNLSLSDCTITGNSALLGGGLENAKGTTTLSGCTITDNTATVAGGGGLALGEGTAALTNCTISGNFASTGNNVGQVGDGGGLFIGFGTATLTNCTVSGDTAQGYGSELYNEYSTVSLNNTIVAGQTGGTDIVNHGRGTTVTGNDNLIGDGSGISGGTGNLLGTPSQPIDPLLAVLADYGGPTATMALLPGSPAIGVGAAGAGIPTTDQRGQPRTGHVDIGAFQSQGFTLTPVAGSTPQSTMAGAAFTNPLAVEVNANNTVEPVNGGAINFVVATPAGGASATTSAATAKIADGQASVIATANVMLGQYTATASAIGGDQASFSLTNTQAYSLLVNTTQDLPLETDGQNSLRAAIKYADSLTGPSAITFDPAVFGTTPRTITLTSGALALTNNTATITIVGPGAKLLTVSGNQASGVFEVEGAVVAMSGLTITGGQADRGGGMVNQGGRLSLTSVTIRGNTAFDQGGGVDTQFGGNTALIDCTVSGNSAGAAGGGLANLYGGAATLTDCTVSDNNGQIGGGLADLNGTMTLTACTISGNSSGLDSASGPPTLTDTIVAGNTGGDIRGAVAPGSANNLIGNGSGMAGISDGSQGNQVGSAAAPIDPLLAPLGDYGGPTPTMALLPGSPAIAGGVTGPGIPTTDQRGEPRTGHVDIGAFQSQGVTLIPTPASSPTPGPTTTALVVQDVDSLSGLRAAVSYADSHPGPDTIVFDPADFGTKRRTIRLVGGPLVLTNPATTTIVGPGARLLTISGGRRSRVFDIRGGSLALEGMTITGGSAVRGGGILNDRGTLALDHVVLRGNRARVGGGLYNEGAATLFDVVIRGNTAGSGSGLFSARDATLLWRGHARPVSTRRIIVDHFNGKGGIPTNWTQFEGQPGDVVEKRHNLTITDSAGNSAGIVSTAKTVPFNPVGVKTTIVARIKSLNANGSAIFGLIGLDAQNSPAGYLAAGIDAHGNVFIASSIAPTFQPTPNLIGAVKGYSGKSITLTFTIKSMGVQVEGGGFKSGLIPFENLSNFSLAAAFPSGNARPALGATSLANEQGGKATFGSINVVTA